MNKTALIALKERCHLAVANGYNIGRTELYVADLQKTVGMHNTGFPVDSPQHLLALIELAEKGVQAPKTMPSPKPVEPPVVIKPEPIKVVAEAAPIEAEAATDETVVESKKAKRGKKGE